MSDYLPIIVAAPQNVREKLHRADVLPQQLLRDIDSEQWWEKPSDPAIYLWPYDIPYSKSDELRKISLTRVGDVPAFFGMAPEDVTDDKDRLKLQQECLLSRFWFGSVVVHIVVLDNKKTDTTQDSRERNETYAQLGDRFDELVKWVNNLKLVLDVRFPKNTYPPARHILLLVSFEEQTIVTEQEIKDLNNRIGVDKPFFACYFLNMNLEQGESQRLFHSEFIWELPVGRFLLALLLSQEKNGTIRSIPLWQKPGIKVWRALDCVVSARQEAGDNEKEAMELATRKLQECLDGTVKDGQLLTNNVTVNRTLFEALTSRWTEQDLDNFRKWAEKKNASWSFSLPHSFFGNWSNLAVSKYEEEIESPEHWAEGFNKLSLARISWCKDNPPEDYTEAVRDFFKVVQSSPEGLESLASRLSEKMRLTSEYLKSKNSQYWQKFAEVEKKHQATLRRLEENSKEFEKAQRHYVGLGMSFLVAAAVTGFSGWMIWQVLSLFNVGIVKILLLSGMVFIGAAAACLLVLLLHNFTGNRAAGMIMADHLEAETQMKDRDLQVREMFYDGIEKRDILALQCVRFRTWLLVKRVLSILHRELEPPLSNLLDNQEAVVLMPEAADASDSAAVMRQLFLDNTRTYLGPIDLNTSAIWANTDRQNFNSQLSKKQAAFFDLWMDLCSCDKSTAGYFPARRFIERIHNFVIDFLEDVHRCIFERSIQDSARGLEGGFQQFARTVLFMPNDETLLSAPISFDNNGTGTRILFISAPFFSYLPDGTEMVTRFKSANRPSKLLEKTWTAALYYQEFDVEFALMPIPDSKTKDSGVLIFKMKEMKNPIRK